MLESINKLLEDVPHDMDEMKKKLAVNHLFDVNDSAKKKAQLFHCIVAKLLFLCRRT